MESTTSRLLFRKSLTTRESVSSSASQLSIKIIIHKRLFRLSGSNRFYPVLFGSNGLLFNIHQDLKKRTLIGWLVGRYWHVIQFISRNENRRKLDARTRIGVYYTTGCGEGIRFQTAVCGARDPRPDRAPVSPRFHSDFSSDFNYSVVDGSNIKTLFVEHAASCRCLFYCSGLYCPECRQSENANRTTSSIVINYYYIDLFSQLWHQNRKMLTLRGTPQPASIATAKFPTRCESFVFRNPLKNSSKPTI